MDFRKAVLLCAFMIVLIPPANSFHGIFQQLGRDFANIGKNIGRSISRAGKDVAKQTMDFGCNTACPRICNDKVGKYICPFICRPMCKNNRGKRSISQVSGYSGHLVPMPNKFSAYDLNEDGQVSLKELAFVSGHHESDQDVKMVFQLSDKNGDKMLSPKELYEGPLVFEMDVNDNDHMYCEYIASRRRNQVPYPVKPSTKITSAKETGQ